MKIDKVDQPELVEKFQTEYNEIKKNIKGLEQELTLTPLGSVEPLKNQFKEAMKILESPYLIYENGDKNAKLAVIRLVYNDNLIYDPIIKRLNLVYSDLIQEIVSKNTRMGNLEVYSRQKLTRILQLFLNY